MKQITIDKKEFISKSTDIILNDEKIKDDPLIAATSMLIVMILASHLFPEIEKGDESHEC